ncbi:hypothetical protein Taro_031570 [Colocasia esculenta]|uniref:Neprosin PEP catalytic domain-containing protein n=1 Tax=Colocasia esculenta TaxID=4460 RepID=A0A843VP75_COLES|nr:hypothetical protein [Colocasia esculenta]
MDSASASGAASIRYERVSGSCRSAVGCEPLVIRGHTYKAIYTLDAIGHWPKRLFTSLAENADSVVFGGEVFFDKDDNGGPPMGSGYLGTETDKAASFTGMQHIDKYGNYDYFSLDDFKFYVDNEACYNTKMTQGPLGVFLFFYGGPRCQSSD